MNEHAASSDGEAESAKDDSARKDETERSDRFTGAAVGAALITLALVGSAKAGGGSRLTPA